MYTKSYFCFLCTLAIFAFLCVVACIQSEDLSYFEPEDDAVKDTAVRKNNCVEKHKSWC